jgi:glyoxylase-like metal-dependent hydrolase (beta-lactamase superfamily II)
MKKVTILSMVTASLLLVGCGTDKRDNTEPAGRLMNQVTVESSANMDSNVQSTLKVKAVATDELKEELLAEIRSELEQRAALKAEIIKELLAEIKSGKITTTTTVTTVKAPITATATPVAPSIKVSSIGADKSVGEIITTAIGGATVTTTATTTASKEEAGSTQDKPFDYKLTPKEVAEGVWCFFGALEPPTKENAGNMANNCYIKTNDGYLVMDTGPSYQFAKQAYEAMQKIEDLPVKYVVNSHEHDDHWLGNDFYKQKFGTTLMGPESINANYKEGDQTRMYNVLPKNAIEGTHIIDLDKVVKKRETLTFGGEKFDVIPMDVKAHTGDDVFIYMPEKNVLFAGDLVMNGRITSNRHGSVMGQLKALSMMQQLDWKVLVPGHGFITDGTSMDEAKMYFELTKERVLKAIDEGVDATEINEVVKLIEFKDKAMYDILNAHNIGFAFDELEMLDEDE